MSIQRTPAGRKMFLGIGFGVKLDLFLPTWSGPLEPSKVVTLHQTLEEQAPETLKVPMPANDNLTPRPE